MAAMQHALGRLVPLAYPAAYAWPPTSFSSSGTVTLTNCRVISVTNILMKKHTEVQGGFLRGKKDDATTFKCVGVKISVPTDQRSTFADSVDAFVEGFPGEYPKENIADGNGEIYTVFGGADTLAVLRNKLGYVGDDILREGDVVNVQLMGGTLFVQGGDGIEVVQQDRGKGVDSQHKIMNMYHAPAVNVDEGLVDNLAKAQSQIDRIKEKAEAEQEAEQEADVDSDEWDD